MRCVHFIQLYNSKRVCKRMCVCVFISATHSPHIDESSAQEGVEVPVDAGQKGDVKHFMTQSG